MIGPRYHASIAYDAKFLSPPVLHVLARWCLAVLGGVRLKLDSPMELGVCEETEIEIGDIEEVEGDDGLWD